MTRNCVASIVTFLGVVSAAPAFAQVPESVWDEAVGGVDKVFLEEMTAGEIAAAMRDGYRPVIVATGGREPNGPNVVTGRHNVVLRATADAIARTLIDYRAGITVEAMEKSLGN